MATIGRMRAAKACCSCRHAIHTADDGHPAVFLRALDGAAHGCDDCTRIVALAVVPKTLPERHVGPFKSASGNGNIDSPHARRIFAWVLHALRADVEDER